MNINIKIVLMSAAFVSQILKGKFKILKKIFWEDCARSMAEITPAIIILTNVL